MRIQEGIQLLVHQPAEVGEMRCHYGGCRVQTAGFYQLASEPYHVRNGEVAGVSALTRALRALYDDSGEPMVRQESPRRILVPARVAGVQDRGTFGILDDVVEAHLARIVLSQDRRHAIPVHDTGL